MMTTCGRLLRAPLKLGGFLNKYKSFPVTPIVGTEFPTANVADWLRSPDSDDLIRDLAITVSQRGVVFFRAQNSLTDDLQKQLAHRLGALTGKPESSTLHIHPLSNCESHGDRHINAITTNKDVKPPEDLFRTQAERPHGVRGSWHTDLGYEPNPGDYTTLKMTQIPDTGGDTMWASSYELYDRISPLYRRFLDSLTVTCKQLRYQQTISEKGFELFLGPRGSPNNVGASLTAVHPLVRTNPVTGWKGLSFLGHHFYRINELTKNESERVHDWLLQMVIENHECQVRHRWKNSHDLAIWDNRSVLHTAIMDFAGLGTRSGHRAVGIGERPYLDPNSRTRRQVFAENHGD